MSAKTAFYGSLAVGFIAGVIFNFLFKTPLLGIGGGVVTFLVTAFLYVGYFMLKARRL